MNRVRLWGIAHRGAAAWICIAAVITATFSRTLFMGQVLYRNDIEHAYIPWSAFLIKEHLAGNWLPWCVDLGCGFPLWANMQSGALYPPNLLQLIPVSPIWTFGFLLAAHYLWAALGTYVLARRTRIGHVGSAVAGLTYSLTGFMMAHQVHYPIVCAASWMPWFAIGLLLWARERSPLGLGLASASLACSWLNHPQTALLVIAFGAACLGIELFVARQAGREAHQGVPSALAMALVPIVVGTLLAGVVLWPGYELVRAGCGDARRGYAFMTSFSLFPANVIRFLLPNFWGGPGEGDRIVLPIGTGGNYWEMCGYVGSICLLSVVATGRRTGQACRLYWALVAVALLALLLAFGRYTPLYRVLQYVPGLDQFRIPARWLLLWSGCMALLGGLAVEEFPAVLRHSVASRRAFWLFAAVAICGGVLSAMILLDADAIDVLVDAVLRVIWPSGGGSWVDPVLPFIGSDLASLSGSAALVAVVIWLSRLKRIDAGWAARLLAFIIVMQACLFAWDYTAVAPPARYHLPDRLRTMLPASIAEGRVAESYGGGYPEELRLVRPNTNLLFGIPSVHIYDPLQPPVVRLQQQLGDRLVRDPAAAAALGISVILTDLPPSRLSPSTVLVAHIPCAGSDRTVYAYRNTRYRALAWTVSHTTSETSARQSIADPHGAVTFLLDAPWISPEPEWSRVGQHAGRPREIQVLEWSARRIAIRVAAGQPSNLVVTSSKLPGWTADLDGVPAPIATVNGVFCAIELPPGECIADLTYTPSGIGLGLALTVMGLVLGLIAALVARRFGSSPLNHLPE